MKTGTWADGAKRRVMSLFGVCMLCVCTQFGTSKANAQVEGPGDPAPPDRTGLRVTTEPGDGDAPPLYRLALTGDPRTSGPTGVFYRTTRPISHIQVIEVEPPAERVIPEGSNPFTQLILWNERAEDGKLWPHRAIRHAGSHAEDLGDGTEPLGNWSDENEDGIDDLGFVCIGMTDYRVMLRYAEFDPVGVSRAGGGEFDADSEPFQVGESGLVEGLRASDVPSGCHMYVVQFWTQPLPEFRAAIETAGGTICGFLAGNSYIVHLTDVGGATLIRSLAPVRFVGSFHPAYRLDELILEQLFSHGTPEAGELRRYNILMHEPGLVQQNAVAERIRALGGLIHQTNERGYILSGSMTPAQLAQIVGMDAVAFIDLWGPDVPEMAIARDISGALYLNDGGGSPMRHFRGQGVAGEVVDGNLFDDVPLTEAPIPKHPDFRPVLRHGTETGTPKRGHGTACYGIVFGSGDNAPNARGMLWDEDAVGIFATYNRHSGQSAISRDQHLEELVDPTGPYRAVFQSNSYGATPANTQYTSVTHEIDSILFKRDVLVCNSHGNTGSTTANQRGWAKNIVSIGGVKHHGSLNRADHRWGGCYYRPNLIDTDLLSYRCDAFELLGGSCDPACSGCDKECNPATSACPPNISGNASIGPAADGRIKPDLVHFYGEVFTTWFRNGAVPPSAPNWYYACGFEGTSCATPIVAGCFGLFFQMWHESVFSGFGGGIDVFDSKCHMTTAKAMLVNTAYRYAWHPTLPELPNSDLTRARQGWGMPDLRNLYDLRNSMFIIDETDILTYVGDTEAYAVDVVGTGVPLRVTMVYADPGGTVSSSQHRINDLTLKVISPTGVVFYGNNGLVNGNWSASSGSKDSKNTVENVFIESPASGTWTIQVQLIELNQDGNYSTPLVEDADFALVVSGATTTGSSVAGDWNNDGDINSTDILDFVSAFLNGSGDANHDGTSDSGDFAAFVDAFLSGKR